MAKTYSGVHLLVTGRTAFGLARPSDVVTAEGRIIGADPDLSIRTEILRDRSQPGF